MDVLGGHVKTITKGVRATMKKSIKKKTTKVSLVEKHLKAYYKDKVSYAKLVEKTGGYPLFHPTNEVERAKKEKMLNAHDEWTQS